MNREIPAQSANDDTRHAAKQEEFEALVEKADEFVAMLFGKRPFAVAEDAFIDYFGEDETIKVLYAYINLLPDNTRISFYEYMIPATRPEQLHLLEPNEPNNPKEHK